MGRLLCIAMVAELATVAAGQPTPAAVRDPQAVLLLSQSLAVMTKGGPIQDIRIEAQATRTAGSETDIGSAVLEGVAYDTSKLNFGFSAGPRNEIRNGGAGVWAGPDGQNRAMALHNCWTAAAWFAPALVAQSWLQDSSFSLAYTGAEERDGTKVHHIRATRSLPGVPDIAALSAMDLYLDAQSLLPAALDWNTHPDDDLGVDLPVDIAFSGYQHSGNVTAPSRIQSYLQGTLLLDLEVHTTAVNTGLPASDFHVPALP